METYKLDKYTLEHGHEALLATALTPASGAVYEVFVEGTQPRATSNYWTVPLPVSDLSVSVDQNGVPIATFSTRQSHVRYRLYRTEGYQKTLVGEWSGATKRVSDKDEGVGNGYYTYYVVPVHPELMTGKREIAGPESNRLSVSVSKVTAPPLELDLTDISRDAF